MKLIYKYIVFVLVLFYSANTFAQAREEGGREGLAPVIIVHRPPPPPPAPPTPPPPPPNNVDPGNGGSGQRNNPGQSAGGGGRNNGSGSGNNSNGNGRDNTRKKTQKKTTIKHKPIVDVGKSVIKKINLRFSKNEPTKGNILDDDGALIGTYELLNPVDNEDGTVTYTEIIITNILRNQGINKIELDFYEDPSFNNSNDIPVIKFIEIKAQGSNNPSNLDFCSGDPCCNSGCSTPTPKIEIIEEPNNSKNYYIDKDGDGYHSETRLAKFRINATYKEITKGEDCDDTNAERNINCEKLKWYLDVDGDGYHGDISFAISNLSTTGVWKSTTKGQDCNDFSKNDTTDCCTTGTTCALFFNETFDEETCSCTSAAGHNWYLDNDGDDYHSQTKNSTKKPGANWKEGTSKGPDCNDSLFDASNNCEPKNDLLEEAIRLAENLPPIMSTKTVFKDYEKDFSRVFGQLGGTKNNIVAKTFQEVSNNNFVGISEHIKIAVNANQILKITRSEEFNLDDTNPNDLKIVTRKTLEVRIIDAHGDVIGGYSQENSVTEHVSSLADAIEVEEQSISEKIFNSWLKYDPVTASNFLRIKDYYNSEKDHLKEIHPDWSETKLVTEAWLSVAQTGLDVIGLIPVAGEIADVVNGAIYIVRGDVGNAVISFAATLPVGGQIGTGGRIAVKAVRTAKGAEKYLPYVKEGSKIAFGSRGDLAKTIAKEAGEEAHHIIPWNKRASKVVQKAADGGFHMNDPINGKALEKFKRLTGDGLHGNHPAYDKFVQKQLDDFIDDFPNATPKQAKDFLEKELIPDLNDYIDAAKGSGKNLNEFFKGL